MTDRRVELMALNDLRPDPRNPKDHDLGTMDLSMARFGFVEPIVVDRRTGLISSGHGRHKALLAMQERGDPAPEGVAVDETTGRWHVPVSTGWASKDDLEAAGALIALNRINELGGWVDESLLDMLDVLREQSALEAVGYDEDDIETLREQLGDLEFTEDEGGAGGRTEAPPSNLLAIADLSMGEPEHQVKTGERWQAGRHHLVVANPHTQWNLFTPALTPGAILAPYPDVWLTLSRAAREHSFVLVQPDPFLAGHLLDKHHTAFPEDAIALVVEG